MSQPQATDQKQSKSIFEWFFHSEVSGSLVLLAATIVALIWANSPWAQSYFDLAHTKIKLSWGAANFGMSLQHWINDGLMVIFFFVVGLEIKRELLVGRLSSFDRAKLPVMAALGGMIVPALIYFLINPSGPESRGWGVPMATDIAFALGILALFGKRAPLGLKVFLTALAIADDLGAVTVIALFYTEEIRWVGLIVAAGFMVAIWLANRANLRRPGLYIILAVGVWAGVLASGVHATVAGIFVAMLVPVRSLIDPERFLQIADQKIKRLRASKLTQESMIDDTEQYDHLEELYHTVDDMGPPGLRLEHHLHPIQAFIILPLFAFFNAGVAITSEMLAIPPAPVTLGIILGLFVGKMVGVFLFSWLAVKLVGGALPAGVTWPQIYGAGLLAGVGFTMSLFVSELAYTDALLMSEAKFGILIGSLISGVVGYLILSRFLPQKPQEEKSSANPG
jgi:NhaA family Na+:H+ antiporter